VFTALIGIAVPFFGGLLGFFGGFAFAPTTYYVSFFFSRNRQHYALHDLNKAIQLGIIGHSCF
jgi:hypothetical protein